MAAFSQIVKVVLRSYGVLAFSAHLIPASLILMATFFHPMVGLMGLIGNGISNGTAKWFHANKDAWNAGVFGVSGILIGLTLGMYSEPSIRLWVFLLGGSVFSGILSVMLGNFLSRYYLPILSLPFILVIWLLLLTLGVSEQDSVSFITIPYLRSIDLWLFKSLPLAVFEYVKMFGNILFQENLFSGILVLTAIGIYSRISLFYGLWGGLVGLGTYTFIHGSLDGFHGLNFILTSLAFGGFFIVNNRHAFIFTTIAIIAVGLVDLGTIEVLGAISSNAKNNIPSLVFAFNVVTLIFLFPLKMMPKTLDNLRLTPIPLFQIRSPETNMKWFRRWSGLKTKQQTILTFPFSGEWSVLQGNHGEWTHKGIGRFAWDFIVRDERKHQASGFGLELKDFYAFGLPVMAPAPGTIYAIENQVEDNPPGEAETERNWGNYVIINHGNGEFSELSHFKQYSITVVPGQFVQRGDIIGYCGNSGRSPVPHIHFQLQSLPEVGAPTLPSTFSEGMQNKEIQLEFIPIKNDLVSSMKIEADDEWSLLGREGQSWVFETSNIFGVKNETLTFRTDNRGLPVIQSNESNTWYIIDRPSFVEIRPDFKTFSSFLNHSPWMDIIGDRLFLPKKLKHGLTTQDISVIKKLDIYTIKTSGYLFVIDPVHGIKSIQHEENDFKYIRVGQSKLKK